jgi:hypothetical protein
LISRLAWSSARNSQAELGRNSKVEVGVVNAISTPKRTAGTIQADSATQGGAVKWLQGYYVSYRRYRTSHGKRAKSAAGLCMNQAD